MCGIAGLFEFSAVSPGERENIVRAMTDSIAHRGPDAHGTWHDPLGRCSLGHRRLSIIDTSDAGRQPMSDASGRWTISFNGEIYNFLELRAQLEAAGCRFRGRTDTEVLLNALSLWGVDALNRLDGMFALAAFDRASGQLVLARDAFGEKPLYYAELAGGGLAFASELQALEKVPGITLEVSRDAIGELLMFQYVGAPRTIYEGIRKLPPGHWLVTYPGQPRRIAQYFSFRPGQSGFDRRPIAELADELEDILVRSLRRRLISDVPLGAFLSGGVDSSTVCALIRRKLGVPLKTYSIGFVGAPESEHEAARAFARHLNTEHHEKLLAPQTSEFLLGIGRLLDEPNADSSCLPTYLLSAFARESVTVALSGDGGDEMFAGYGRYFHTLDDAERASAARDTGWHPGNSYYSNRILVSLEDHVRELLGEVPPGTQRHVERLREELAASEHPLHCRLRRSDVENYMPGAVLPKVDRMSMQHALEVRTPFLSLELARFAERLPQDVLYDGKRGKLILREIAYRYLPRELIDLPKQGFGLPMSRWAKDELLGTTARLVEDPDSRLADMLGKEAIARFMTRQRSEHGFATYQVWALAMLESWLRHRPGVALAPARASDVVVTASAGAGTQPQRNWTAETLFLWPYAGRVFAVSEDPKFSIDARPGEPGHDPLIIDEFLRLSLRSPEVGAQLDQAPDSTGPLRMPGWLQLAHGEIDAATRQALRDAILVFPRINLSDRAGWPELERLRALGVRLLVSAHPYRGDGAIFQLELKRTGWAQERLAALRLRWSGQCLHTFLRSTLVAGEMHQSGPLHGVPPLEQELSEQYMLFEGSRQMPPLPAQHTLIQSAGGGRYSVWAQNLYFSTGARTHAVRRLIARSKANEALLQYVPQLIPGINSDVAQFFQALRTWVARHARTSVATDLQIGDRVVVMTHALPPGGAERQWVYLARELKRRGFDAVFLVIEPLEGDNGHYLPMLQEQGIEVVNVMDEPIRKAFSLLPNDPEARRLILWPGNPLGVRLLQLTAALRRLAPKVVFTQLDFPNVLAGCAGLLAGTPRTVLSFRNFNPSNFPYLHNDWFLPLYRILAGSPRMLLSGNARAANDDYAAWIGIPSQRVRWIGNALEPNDLGSLGMDAAAKLRGELALSVDSRVVLGVFRMSEEKRPLLFVQVCAEVAKRVPSVRFLLAGVGPMAAQVRRAVADQGLGDKFRLLGRRDDVAALMSITNVLLLTSAFEGMPNVAMEAQVLGLPVVATNVGGAPDCIDHGRTGYLVDIDDVDGYVEGVVTLLSDQQRAARFSDAARRWSAQRFSHARMADEFLKLATSVPADVAGTVVDRADLALEQFE